MNLEEAKEYARVNRLMKNKSVHATSDGSFYLNADVDFLASHASEKGLELFTIKGEEVKPKKTKKDASQ